MEVVWMTNINDIDIGALIDRHDDSGSIGEIPGRPGWRLHLPDDPSKTLEPDGDVYWTREESGFVLIIRQMILWDGDYMAVLALGVHAADGGGDRRVPEDQGWFTEDLEEAQDALIKAVTTDDWSVLDKYKTASLFNG